MAGLAVLLLVLAAGAAQAEPPWHSQAVLDLPRPGLVETVLPPELHRVPTRTAGAGLSPETLDLSLIGPDGRSRACELFWKEEIGTQSLSLVADRVELRDDHTVVWEGTVPEGFLVRRLQASIAGGPAIGRMDVAVATGPGVGPIPGDGPVPMTGTGTVRDTPVGIGTDTPTGTSTGTPAGTGTGAGSGTSTAGGSRTSSAGGSPR